MYCSDSGGGRIAMASQGHVISTITLKNSGVTCWESTVPVWGWTNVITGGEVAFNNRNKPVETFLTNCTVTLYCTVCKTASHKKADIAYHSAHASCPEKNCMFVTIPILYGWDRSTLLQVQTIGTGDSMKAAIYAAIIRCMCGCSNH